MSLMREPQEATQTQSKGNYLPALQADSLLRSRREVTGMRTKAILPSTMMEQNDGKIEDHGSVALSYLLLLVPKGDSSPVSHVIGEADGCGSLPTAPGWACEPG